MSWVAFAYAEGESSAAENPAAQAGAEAEKDSQDAPVSMGSALAPLPYNARGVDVVDQVGKFVPLNVLFTDESGRKIGLGKYFNQGKPIVLTLNYSDCPGLCIAQLDNLTGCLRAMKARGMGEEYEIVTISIDPAEDHFKAAKTKAKYATDIGNDEAHSAWHFLTGDRESIQEIAEAVGFKYTWDAANNRYNHPAVTYFISPEGRICRYLLSLGVEPQQFQLAVAEASDSKLTFSIADAFIQMCYLYDPDANRYSASARRILAFAAAGFCMLLVGTTAPFWFRGKKNPATTISESASKSESNPEASAASNAENPSVNDSNLTT
ncbi:MAG: SCO family protein [Planctomycetota bacterium]